MPQVLAKLITSFHICLLTFPLSCVRFLNWVTSSPATWETSEFLSPHQLHSSLNNPHPSPAPLLAFCEYALLITTHPTSCFLTYMGIFHTQIWSYRLCLALRRGSPLSPKSSPCSSNCVWGSPSFISASPSLSPGHTAQGNRLCLKSLFLQHGLTLYSWPLIYLIHFSKFSFTNDQMLTSKTFSFVVQFRG